MKNQATLRDLKNFKGSFYSKKPSVSFQNLHKQNNGIGARRKSKKFGGLSKTKTLQNASWIESSVSWHHNKSVMGSSNHSRLFTKKNSLVALHQNSSVLSPRNTNRFKPQVNKLSPRSMMNSKSKKICYNNFLREFREVTKKYPEFISKQDLFEILVVMRYFEGSSAGSDFEQRATDYLYRLWKHHLSNLKIILLWMESFYADTFSPKKQSPRCQSPKMWTIRYDVENKIVEVPEEYKEFLRRKFSKLWVNRSLLKKHTVRASKTNLRNYPSVGYKTLTNNSTLSQTDKVNRLAKTSPLRSSVGVKIKTLKSLTAALVKREFEVQKAAQKNIKA